MASDSFALLPPTFYDRPADQVARDLLGRYLHYDGPAHSPADPLKLRIVETEAYLGAKDRASHAWNGRRTQRNESLYLPPGHTYVYLIYGIHHCLNVVTAGSEEGAGSAVLLRAGQVIDGAKTMAARRRLKRSPRAGDLAGGPGKLCQALGINRQLDGIPFGTRGLSLSTGDPVNDSEVSIGPRIGIDYAEEAVSWPLRFAISHHPEMSRPRI